MQNLKVQTLLKRSWTLDHKYRTKKLNPKIILHLKCSVKEDQRYHFSSQECNFDKLV